MTEATMADHKVGTHEEWLAAREQLLVREKEHTRIGDELARQRRELPWVRVEKDYRFDTDDGERELSSCSTGALSSCSTTSCSDRATRPAVR
jgi:predicted dithiol-disulfide oxidoreductase (DUF899 family)